jgi:quercetin dioxygenase-like cupin family protein
MSNLDLLVRHPAPANSIWYGSALITFLATAEMTGGSYSMLHGRMSRGFTPPAPHRHGPEDFQILRGTVRFWVGTDELLAEAGDYVHTVPGGWHTLQAESDEVEMLAIFAPAGPGRLLPRARQAGRSDGAPRRARRPARPRQAPSARAQVRHRVRPARHNRRRHRTPPNLTRQAQPRVMLPARLV